MISQLLRTEDQRLRWRALLAAHPAREREMEARVALLARRYAARPDPVMAALQQVAVVEQALGEAFPGARGRSRWVRVLPAALAAGVLVGVLVPEEPAEEARFRGVAPEEIPKTPTLSGDLTLHLMGADVSWTTPLGLGAGFVLPWSPELRLVPGRPGLVAYRVEADGIASLAGVPGQVTAVEGPTPVGGPGTIVVAEIPPESDAIELATALRDGEGYTGRPRSARLVVITLEAR